MTDNADAGSGYQARVSELPADERPRERLERLGAKALTSAELLAILLRTDSARDDVLHLASRLLQEHGGGLRALAGEDLPTLAAIHGLVGANATTIAAAFELGRRLALEGGEERPTVTSP
jgi:DNA repair protein RadC